MTIKINDGHPATADGRKALTFDEAEAVSPFDLARLWADRNEPGRFSPGPDRHLTGHRRRQTSHLHHRCSLPGKVSWRALRQPKGGAGARRKPRKRSDPG